MEGREISATPRTTSDSGLSKSSARFVPPQSVILSTRAPIGHLAINLVPMAFNQGCRGLVPSKRLDHLYLCHFLAANKQKLDGLGSGTTFKELSATNLKSVELPLPPLEEQKRIVAVLDQAVGALDRVRALAEANSADAVELFDSAMTDALGSFQSTRSANLGDVTVFITDGTHQTPTCFESGHVFLSSKSVREGRIGWDNVKYLNDAQHIRMQRRLSPQMGDILLRKNGAGYGKAAIVDRDVVFDVYVSLAVLRPNGMNERELMLRLINSTSTMMQFEDRIKGHGVPNLHLSEIKHGGVKVSGKH